MCVALTATARVVFLFSSQLNAKFGDQLIHIKSANLDTWPRPRVLYLDELSSVNQTNTSSFCIRQLKASESRNLLIAALINWIGGFSRSEAPAGMFLNCLFLPFFFFCPLHTSARSWICVCRLSADDTHSDIRPPHIVVRHSRSCNSDPCKSNDLSFHLLHVSTTTTTTWCVVVVFLPPVDSGGVQSNNLQLRVCLQSLAVTSAGRRRVTRDLEGFGWMKLLDDV